MTQLTHLLVAVCCIGLIAGGALRATAEENGKADETAKKACKMQSVFACTDCKGMATMAGKCACGKELKKVE